MKTCDECGQQFQKISSHWRYNEPHRKKLTREQKDIITGMMMGDASADLNAGNAYIEINMTNLEFLKHLKEKLGVFANEIKKVRSAEESAADMRDRLDKNAKSENYSDIYNLNTIRDERFNKYRKWYKSGKKVWPKDIDMTRNVLKYYYVSDGSYPKGEKYINITLQNERDNKKKVYSYFKKVDAPKPDKWYKLENHCSIRWNKNSAREIFNYMGDPLPGFEYKWPESHK